MLFRSVLNARQLERKVVGGRLLAVSSEFLKRVFYLSYSYRMTGDKKYLERAEKEMLTVADFSDWHLKHFLDVAEMTMGMAINHVILLIFREIHLILLVSW